MIKSIPPPKPKYPGWLFMSYAYASVLVVYTLAQLVGLGGFDFAGIAYETPGSPLAVIAKTGVFIFALPFLLRLHLSPLARATSALLSLVAAILLVADLPMFVGVLAVPMAIVSFKVLQGERAIKACVPRAGHS